jgi:hypothetical protein
MGFNLTPQKKLVSVNQKLGNTAITQQQATSREIFDTIAYGTTTTNYSFFSDFSNKGVFETNLTTNKLDSQESMVVNEIILTQERGAASITNFLQGHTKFNLFIGNQRVIKDFDFAFNASESFSFFPIFQVAADGFSISIPCITSIAIPPQTSILATVETENSSAAASGTDYGLKLTLKGYGTLFNPSTSL